MDFQTTLPGTSSIWATPTHSLQSAPPRFLVACTRYLCISCRAYPEERILADIKRLENLWVSLERRWSVPPSACGSRRPNSRRSALLQPGGAAPSCRGKDRGWGCEKGVAQTRERTSAARLRPRVWAAPRISPCQLPRHRERGRQLSPFVGALGAGALKPQHILTSRRPVVRTP